MTVCQSTALHSLMAGSSLGFCRRSYYQHHTSLRLPLTSSSMNSQSTSLLYYPASTGTARMSMIFVTTLPTFPISCLLLMVAQPGTFGWIIGTTDGLRLAAGSGPVFRFDPRSYRAETYGCRSGMTFVQLAFRFCHLPMRGTHSVRFDNQGLLKKQSSFRKFALAKYSAALHSEWDAIISVYNLMDRFPQLPVLEHVLGHRDKELDYDDPPSMHK